MNQENIGDFKLIRGMKSRNGSLKILKLPDGKFIVQKKKYLFNLCVSKKNFFFDSFQDAEDKFIELRFSTGGKIH